MVGSRITSALRSALPATAVAAAAVVLLSAPVAAAAAALPASAPATCLPHCDNALYPYVESVRATGDEAGASTDTVLPGRPPAG